MLKNCFVYIERSKNLVVSLKYLDGVPSLLLLGKSVNGSLLNVSKCMLNNAGERVLRNGLCVLRGVDSSLCRLHYARALQSGDLNDLAAQLS